MLRKMGLTYQTFFEHERLLNIVLGPLGDIILTRVSSLPSHFFSSNEREKQLTLTLSRMQGVGVYLQSTERMLVTSQPPFH